MLAMMFPRRTISLTITAEITWYVIPFFCSTFNWGPLYVYSCGKMSLKVGVNMR
jgi:hypothetical protein